jgi:hypothetical protein
MRGSHFSIKDLRQNLNRWAHIWVIQAKADNGVSYLHRAKDLARFGLAEARRIVLSLHPAQGVVSIADSEPDSGSTETEF